MDQRLEYVDSALQNGMELHTGLAMPGGITAVLRNEEGEAEAVGRGDRSLEAALCRLIEGYKGVDLWEDYPEGVDDNLFSKSILREYDFFARTDGEDTIVELEERTPHGEITFFSAQADSFTEVYSYITRNSNILYVAHPLGGDIEQNLERIADISHRIHTDDSKDVPFTPYVESLEYLDDGDPDQRALGMKKNEKFFRRQTMDEIMLAGPELSSGMRQELEWAEENNVPVRLWNQDLRQELEEFADSEDLEFTLKGQNSPERKMKREIKARTAPEVAIHVG